MRGWTPEEDSRLLELIQESGKRWKLIAESLGPSNQRTPAMVRNRYLRIERGRWLTNNGMSKNRCGQCGQLKRGHVCKTPRAMVDTSYSEQEARHREARLLAVGDDVLLYGAPAGHVGSIEHVALGVLSSSGVGALAGIGASRTSPEVVDMGSSTAREGSLGQPPPLIPLTTQGSMEILVMAAISRDSSVPADSPRVPVDSPGKRARAQDDELLGDTFEARGEASSIASLC